MTVNITRTFHVEDCDCETVWEFISAPSNRAEALSVVDDYEILGSDPNEERWQLTIPLPLTSRTVDVKTRETTRDPPHVVRFRGKSKIMDIRGEHQLLEDEDGCRIQNTFQVDGKIPGVETFFKKNFDDEVRNLEADLREYLD